MRRRVTVVVLCVCLSASSYIPCLYTQVRCHSVVYGVFKILVAWLLLKMLRSKVLVWLSDYHCLPGIMMMDKSDRLVCKDRGSSSYNTTNLSLSSKASWLSLLCICWSWPSTMLAHVVHVRAFTFLCILYSCSLQCICSRSSSIMNHTCTVHHRIWTRDSSSIAILNCIKNTIVIKCLQYLIFTWCVHN